MTNWDPEGNLVESNTPPPEIAVARAVQRLAGRAVRGAMIPLGGLLLAGVFGAVRNGVSRPTVILVAGALASGLVMLSYGVQAVRRVLGRSPGAWGPLFWVASWIPYVYGMYVTFWMGLRELALLGFERPFPVAFVALAYSILGAMTLRAQWKLSEVHSLAQEMTGFASGSEITAAGPRE